MGLKVTDDVYAEWVRKGLVPPDVPAPATTDAKPAAAKLIDCPGLIAGFDGYKPSAAWLIAVETRSEANGREWRSRSSRTQAARRAVSRAFGPSLRAAAPLAEHYHGGGALRVLFTRIGVRKLDAANLGPALKATEDAVAMLLGADDGDERWRSEFAQEPDRDGRCGVRVEMWAV